MSGHPQQPNQGISHQQMSMQNARMGGRAFPVYGGMPARQQVLMPMQSNMSQHQRMAQQPRYIIARPPPQNGQNPSNNQQMHAGSPQVYQQTSNQNPQMMHQMNRNQQRPPSNQQIQIMQQSQGTPPNQQQNYNTNSPYTPPTPQQQFSNQHQMDQRHYNQPSTPQDRQVHQRIQQQGIQRPMTPQQQHSQSPVPRKNTVTMVRTNSLQSSDGSQPSDQHYVVQTSTPTSVYNVVQGSSSQPQIMHQVHINDNSQQDSNYNQTTRTGGMQMRHPISQRPLQYTNQPANPSIVRYSYPAGQQPTQSIVIQQPRNVIRSTGPDGFRQQYIQVVRSESDFPGSATYRMPISSNDQNYVVTSQPNVYYRSTTPQQPNSAIRQALENNYQPQPIQTSQTIIQSMDGSNGQVVFKMPASMQRQTSSDSYDSNSYMQNSVPSVVEATVSEYAADQHLSQRSNMDEDTPSDLSGSYDDASPAKKAKLTPKSGKGTNSSAPKPKSKPKKAPIKTIPTKTISTIGHEYGHNGATNGHYSTGTKPILSKESLEQTAKSVSQNLTLEEEAKAGIIMYMEQFITRLVHETGRATNLRKSKMIQNKDVEYALKTKFNTDSINSEKMDNIAAKFSKG